MLSKIRDENGKLNGYWENWVSGPFKTCGQYVNNIRIGYHVLMRPPHNNKTLIYYAR